MLKVTNVGYVNDGKAFGILWNDQWSRDNKPNHVQGLYAHTREEVATELQRLLDAVHRCEENV